jgi:hypothetical protein
MKIQLITAVAALWSCREKRPDPNGTVVRLRPKVALSYGLCNVNIRPRCGLSES